MRLSKTFNAGKGIFFFMTERTASPFYKGEFEYHGYFSRARLFERKYNISPVGNQFPFTFVASDLKDLRNKISKGAKVIDEIEAKLDNKREAIA